VSAPLRELAAAAALAALVLIAHGASLNDGLFFDDHWHRANLRERGWSLHDLVESATFELPGRLMNLWWQERPLQWRYPRPVAILAMKLEYTLTGGDPVGLHACGLAWHWLTALLVYRLGRWVLSSTGWALLAAGLFVIHPHSVFAVSWIAARNALVGGFFFTAAVYAYATASLSQDRTPRAFSAPRLAVALAAWLLALFSRETAVIFPLVALLLDLSFGGPRHLLRRGPLHALLWLLAGAFVFWRLFVFPHAQVPGVYFTPPDDAHYVLWAASKLLFMLFALTFQTPMFMGLATYDGQVTEPLTHAIIAALLAAAAVGYGWASRGWPGRWVWPAWVVAALVPVVPVFVTPHFAYLPAVALVIMMAAVLRRLPRAARFAVPALLLVITLGALWLYRIAWRGIVRAEQLVYADLAASALSATASGSAGKAFFIDLPPAAIYATVVLRDVLHAPDLEGWALTFTPHHPLMTPPPCDVERRGPNQLVVCTTGPGYFSDLCGRMLLDSMRPDSPLRPGTVIPGELFDTTILEADERGVTSLVFTFRRPLDSPDFYFCSPAGSASVPPATDESSRESGYGDRARYDRWRADRERYFALMRFVRRVVRSNVYLTGRESYAVPEPPLPVSPGVSENSHE
jgi:hypothetical protein